jgi:circadian clock protein KaiC
MIDRQATGVAGKSVPTGVPGLDDVLGGGFVPNRLFLVEGDPGSGKTTLALQFLLNGVANGERCLFVTLSETEEELRASAASHGWTLDDIHVLEIAASDDSLQPESRYTMYHPSEVELNETTKRVIAEGQRLEPTLIVLDSLSELRLLAENPLRYRRQILALKQHFTQHYATVLFCDDKTSQERDEHLHSLAHGVISLERTSSEYGTNRRRVQVSKLRGRAFREGYHDYVIRAGGLEVFPRLVAAEHLVTYARQTVKSDLPELDRLLGGGLAKGTSTLLMGASGTGKSSLATHFALAAAKRGERAALFLFDESYATFFERSRGLGFDLENEVRAGTITVRQVDPAEMSPGHFSAMIRRHVEEDGISMVMIDSLNGFLNAMPSEKFLAIHLHELLTYLGQQGVTTLLLMAEHGLLGENMKSPVDASYIADTVLLVRFYEVFGEVRRALSVIKKRTGDHERVIREMRFHHGIQIGEPLREIRGILRGTAEPAAAKGG